MNSVICIFFVMLFCFLSKTENITNFNQGYILSLRDLSNHRTSLIRAAKKDPRVVVAEGVVTEGLRVGRNGTKSHSRMSKIFGKEKLWRRRNHHKIRHQDGSSFLKKKRSPRPLIFSFAFPEFRPKKENKHTNQIILRKPTRRYYGRKRFSYIKRTSLPIDLRRTGSVSTPHRTHINRREWSNPCSPGCERCSTTNGCLHCKESFYLTLFRKGNRQKGFCKKKCPHKYFEYRKQGSHLCLKCAQNHCMKCSGSSYYCIRCDREFRSVNGRCIKRYSSRDTTVKTKIRKKYKANNGRKISFRRSKAKKKESRRGRKMSFKKRFFYYKGRHSG